MTANCLTMEVLLVGGSTSVVEDTEGDGITWCERKSESFCIGFSECVPVQVVVRQYFSTDINLSREKLIVTVVVCVKSMSSNERDGGGGGW